MAHKEKAYRFDVGDSTEGPVGFCARVRAKSKGMAVKKLRDAIERINGEFEVLRDELGLEYLAVYFNPQAITSKDIDDWEAL